MDVLLAIMAVLDVADEVDRAELAPEGPLATGAGTKACAPAQHIAIIAADFMVLSRSGNVRVMRKG